MSLASAGAVRPGSHHRGEATRRRLIESAIETFAAHGYEGATTRILAERASATLPAIQYHFGSKEGLYRAAIDHIVQWIDARMAPSAERVMDALNDTHDLPRAKLLDLLHDMLDLFVVITNGGEHPESWCLFLSRAEIENMAALEPLHETVTRRLVGPCAGLVGRLTGRPAEDEETLLRTLTLVGQITIFSKKGARAALGWNEVGPAQVRAIQAVVRRQTEAILASTGSARP